MNNMMAQIQSLPDLAVEIFHPLDEGVRMGVDHDLAVSLKRIFITGCGDSHHASLCSELAFETLTGLPCEPMTAQQFARYAAGFIPKTGPLTNLVIGISVSGAVARTLEALRMANQAGSVTLALTATPGSPIAMEAQKAIVAMSPSFPEPPGVHVPGVRTYFTNQMALLLIAVRIGEVRGHLTPLEASGFREELKGLSFAIEKTISMGTQPAKELAESWKDAHEFVFVGGGPNYGSALFSAAKVLEASGDSSLGQETEEWCHLQYFAKERDTPTFFITAGDRDLSRVVESAVAARALGRRIVAVAPETALGLKETVDLFWPVAKTREMFSPLVSVLPGELFAASRAGVMGETYFRDFSGGREMKDGFGISRIRNSETWQTWKS
jgi:glucosamine--fructose-6-phosphate aminotransferase (isomerizing)